MPAADALVAVHAGFEWPDHAAVKTTLLAAPATFAYSVREYLSTVESAFGETQDAVSPDGELEAAGELDATGEGLVCAGLALGDDAWSQAAARIATAATAARPGSSRVTHARRGRRASSRVGLGLISAISVTVERHGLPGSGDARFVRLVDAIPTSSVTVRAHVARW
jgi:hypothetical protein